MNVPSWNALIQGWQSWLVAAGRPETTLSLRTYQLEKFAGDFANTEPTAVTEGMIIDWLNSHEWATETRRSNRSAIRSFYGWAHSRGHIPKDPSALLPPISAQLRMPRPTPESILAGALLQATDRVRLMIELAARQGLRRGEIAQVHTRDVEESGVHWSLRVHGKGNKERVIPLQSDLALRIRDHRAGFVFPGNDHGHLSPRWVGRLIRNTLDTPGWTAHTLRHRFATRTYAGSRDLLTIQSLLGHSRPETTLHYVQLPDDSMRNALTHVA